MKKKFLIMFLAVTGMSVMAVFAQENLVPNGNMDTYTTSPGVPDEFKIIQKKGDVFSRAEGRGGTGYSVRVQTDSVTNGVNRLATKNTIALVVGTYRISFYAKGKGRINWVRISTSPSSAGTNSIVDLTVINNSDWELVDSTFNVSAPADYYLYIAITASNEYNVSPADLYLDDISIVKVTATGSVAKPSASSVSDGASGVRANKGNISIVGEEKDYTVYTSAGALIALGNHTSGETKIPVSSDFYIVKIANEAKKVFVP
jgi:hypothetical protein